MRVIIDHKVVKAIDNFYIVAMNRHISLSEGIVMAKKQRLIASLVSLGDYYFIYPKARWKHEWITNNWQDFLCEDFHFAYEEILDKNSQKIVFVCDAVHSFLYH